ncbi:MAG: 50S ribosomal protein L22 [Dehalococcoidia bacterium]
MEATANARQIRISPRKVRLVLDTVRGKKVDEALDILSFLPTPAARVVAKVVRSAVANAENNYQMMPSQLRVTRIFAGDGRRLKRFRAGARGRVSPLLTRFSHITVVVEEV